MDHADTSHAMQVASASRQSHSYTSCLSIEGSHAQAMRRGLTQVTTHSAMHGGAGTSPSTDAWQPVRPHELLSKSQQPQTP